MCRRMARGRGMGEGALVIHARRMGGCVVPWCGRRVQGTRCDDVSVGLVDGTGRCHYIGLRLLDIHPCTSTTIEIGAAGGGGQRAVAAPVGLTCPHPANRPSRHRWQSRTSISGQCGGVPAIVAAGILMAPPHPPNRPSAHQWPSMTLEAGPAGRGSGRCCGCRAASCSPRRKKVIHTVVATEHPEIWGCWEDTRPCRHLQVPAGSPLPRKQRRT